MQAGVQAGRLAFRAGRMKRQGQANPSSPTTGLIR
jgi:thiazole synthase ThiGH ThiG subunit